MYLPARSVLLVVNSEDQSGVVQIIKVASDKLVRATHEELSRNEKQVGVVVIHYCVQFA